MLLSAYTYQFGDKVVTHEVIEAVLAPDLDALEATLTRQGYNVRALADLLNVRTAEVRALLHGQLPPGRSEELRHELLSVGIPL